jgi:hypothetical protein
MNFTFEDRQKGQAAMERTLTAAGKVRRRFAAGRPPKPGNWVDRFSALRTIAARLDALTAAMAAEGLKPQDLSASIVISQLAQGPDSLTSRHIISAEVERLTLVRKGTSHLSAVVGQVLSNPGAVIVGVIFEIVDHETQPEPTRRRWATPVFRDEDGAADQVLAAAMAAKKVLYSPNPKGGPKQ